MDILSKIVIVKLEVSVNALVSNASEKFRGVCLVIVSLLFARVLPHSGFVTDLERRLLPSHVQRTPGGGDEFQRDHLFALGGMSEGELMGLVNLSLLSLSGCCIRDSSTFPAISSPVTFF
jgi:hypothetical protein